MTYMRDKTGVRLDGIAVATRPATGRLRHRPAATGSGGLYLADDDCGGTLYQDVAAGVWARPSARGELVSVETPVVSNWTISTATTSVYGAFMEIVTDSQPRAIEVSVDAVTQIGNPSTDTAWTNGQRYIQLRLTENGATVRDGYAFSNALAPIGPNVHMSARRILAPNTSYAWQLYYASQSGSPTVNVRLTSIIMKVVEL